MIANYNGFRAAHLALKQVEPIIKDHLKEGDVIEIEVLLGQQPNTIIYDSGGTNSIAIIRGVSDTPSDRVNSLTNALNGKTVSVKSIIISSSDGTNLQMDDKKLIWKFTRVRPIDPAKIDTPEIKRLLSQLKKFASEKNSVFKDKTNEEVSELNMTSIPKDRRQMAKEEKTRVNNEIKINFKLPIKELLLDKFVRKIKSSSKNTGINQSEDMEGVVVRDPQSDNQIKIVDKDMFTAVNSFNSLLRSSVSGTVKTTDQDSAIESRGGIFGQAKIRIADLLGVKELALSSGIKRFVLKFKKENVNETAKAIADSLNIDNFSSIKIKISAILNNAQDEINLVLNNFKKEADNYKLKLKSGKEIGLSPDVMKRTLTSFAETKKNIEEIINTVNKSKTPTELVIALYGKNIESIFKGTGEKVKETYILLKSIIEDGAAATSAGAVST